MENLKNLNNLDFFDQNLMVKKEISKQDDTHNNVKLSKFEFS